VEEIVARLREALQHIDRERLLAVVKRHVSGGDQGPTVLVVDDDDATRQLVRSTLERQGYAVAEAEHGQAALELLVARPVALVLLDLMMPVMDGFAFLDALCLRPSPPPVVVVTAKELTSEDRERLNHHVKTVVQKGSSRSFLEQVREQVASCVRQR